MWALFVVIVIGIIEGVTEFLPVSSTGHMVLAEWVMHVDLHDPFWTLFTVFIQIGAIFAVLVYFRNKVMRMLFGERTTASTRRPDWRMLWMIAIGTLPVLIVGYLSHKWVESTLKSPMVIVATLGIGGLLMIVIEKLPLSVRTAEMERMTLSQALLVGLAQILAAVFPGTSRSAATIMGGMACGMSRAAATEFSFFLAIPAMFAACGYELLKNMHHLSANQAMLLALGTVIAFLVAWVVIAAFMRYIRRHNFIPFGVYRILLAGIFAAVYYSMVR